MENKFDSLTHEQKLKVAVFNEVRKICDEIGKATKFNFNRQSKDLISQLLWRKLKIYGEDVEQFAKHAKRSTVNSDDIKLLVRRNPTLKEHISKLVEENSKKEPRKNKSKKEVPSAGSSTTEASSTSRSESPSEEAFDVD